MSEKGTLFLNGDDPLLRDVVPEGGRKKVLYGLSEGCDYRGEDLHLEEGYPVFTAVHGDEKVQLRLQVMGVHMVQNALAALAVAGEYGISMEMAAEPLCRFEGFKGRQQIVHLNGVTVIDDSYNASPVSMKAGIEVLGSLPCEGKQDRCSCRYEGIRTGYCKIPSGGRCFLKRASCRSGSFIW